MSPVQIESGVSTPVRPIVRESIEDETNTCACDACDGDHAGCEFCYRGRISGWTERRYYDELEFVLIPCDAEQRAAVDRYLDDCDRECSLCDRRIPTTSPMPICPRCAKTCEAHGALDRERARQERVA